MPREASNPPCARMHPRAATRTQELEQEGRVDRGAGEGGAVPGGGGYTKSENFPHCICKCVMKIFSPHTSHAASMPFVPTKSFYHWPARTDFSSALHRSRQTAASTDTPVLGHSTQRQSAGDDASSPLPHG